MKKPTFSEFLQALLLIAVFLGLYLATDDRIQVCARNGGVLVRTIFGFECVVVVRK